MKAPRIPLRLMGALLAAAVACSPDDTPTGVGGERLLSLDRRSAADDSLQRALELEKERVKLEAQLSQRVYDSLKVEWDRYHDTYEGSSPLLFCDPLQYNANVQIVGPAGGDLSIGPHKLSIPRGALSRDVVITGEMPVSLIVSVKLSPHGLTFLKQPTLTLSYKHCLRPSEFQEQVAYIDDDQTILEWPRSLDRDGLISAWLDHFSGYAVAHGKTDKPAEPKP
jgi:hypothetical protein